MGKNDCFGQFDGDKVIVTDNNSMSLLYSKHFGEKYNKYLVLDQYESLYLAENDRLDILVKAKKIDAEQLIKKILENCEKEYFFHRYSVYKDLRQKGHIVKTGLKFGFDFRIYPKGKTIAEAHTEFVITILPENKQVTPDVLARSIRMAKGLHTSLVLAIVDNELEISYYTLDRPKL